MASPISRIGVFDSGLGGLTVLRALSRRLPHLDYMYLGDTARTPYGSKSGDTIRRYALECSHFLLEREIDLLVIACNTASAFALSTIQDECSCPIVGAIEPAVRSCLATPNTKHIGVIGTAGTISSQVYQERLKHEDPNLSVVGLPCPLFVPLVEEGLFAGTIVEQIVEHYLWPLKSQNLEALILGCTHYPLLRHTISSYMGPQVRLIECSEAIADEVASLCEVSPNGESPCGSVSFFVTDSVGRFNSLARLILEDTKVEAVEVEKLAFG